MNIDNYMVRELQLLLQNFEMDHRINDKASKESYEGEFMKGAIWGMQHANSTYTEHVKQLRSLVERIGKGNLYLIDDVNLNGGEDHATA